MATMRSGVPAPQNIEGLRPTVAGAVALAAGQAFDTAGHPLTGCVSSLSACAAIDHAYTDALKSYGEVYTAAQDYLTPADVLSMHDYDRAIAMSMPELNRPEAGHDMLGFVAQADIPVSEEEIEHCGYMAWLRH
jgi:hypothetical protein